MASATQEFMTAEINRFIDKILQGAGGNRYAYTTGTVPANSSIVLDAPTLVNFTAATHYQYSLGVELRMVDPFTTPNPPVIDANAVLSYAIAADGTVTLRNNHNAVVTYHVRFTAPVAR